MASRVFRLRLTSLRGIGVCPPLLFIEFLDELVLMRARRHGLSS
jgi:hypothetical protein